MKMYIPILNFKYKPFKNVIIILIMVNMPLSLKTFVFSQKKQCITSASNTNNKEALLNQSVNQPCAKTKKLFSKD